MYNFCLEANALNTSVFNNGFQINNKSRPFRESFAFERRHRPSDSLSASELTPDPLICDDQPLRVLGAAAVGGGGQIGLRPTDSAKCTSKSDRIRAEPPEYKVLGPTASLGPSHGRARAMNIS